MGFSVYASCYVKSGSDTDLLPAIEKLKGRSLHVPGAEPITVCAPTRDLPENFPRCTKVAWCYSKVAYSINPMLAEYIFISMFASIARRLGPDVVVVISDDSGLERAVDTYSAGSLALNILLGIVITPFWILMMMIGSLGR